MSRFSYLLALLAATSTLACQQSSTGSGGKDINADQAECAGTLLPANAEFCFDACERECDAAKDGQVDSCCVFVAPPDTQLIRSSSVKEYGGKGAPDLGCFEPAGYPTKIHSGEGDPPLVTLQGVVKAFSSGCDLKGVTIQVFEVQRTGDPETDGMPGGLVGTAVTTTEESEEVLEKDEDCPSNDDQVINRRYSYPGVPMNTELMIVTDDPGNDWRKLYTYNVFIAEPDPDLDLEQGTYTRDLRALKETDFDVIPTVAIGKPITAGNGALGGEIHDCENVRLEHAVVNTNGPRFAVVYFNDNEENPMPENGRTHTGTTSVFAALDVKPGFHRVSAVGLDVSDEASVPVTLGYYDVRVFADSVTSVTLKGLQPHQVP